MAETKAQAGSGESSSGEKPHGVNPDSKSARDVAETGGPGRLDPTRYGDWEKNGRCIDF